MLPVSPIETQPLASSAKILTCLFADYAGLDQPFLQLSAEEGSFSHRHPPMQLVEEVLDEYHFVIGLGRFRGFHRRQHSHALAVRRQIPQRPA